MVVMVTKPNYHARLSTFLSLLKNTFSPSVTSTVAPPLMFPPADAHQHAHKNCSIRTLVAIGGLCVVGQSMKCVVYTTFEASERFGWVAILCLLQWCLNAKEGLLSDLCQRIWKTTSWGRQSPFGDIWEVFRSLGVSITSPFFAIFNCCTVLG